MIKAAGIIIIAVSALCYGCLRAVRLKSHERRLCDIMAMLDAIERGIRCRRSNIGELMRSLCSEKAFARLTFLRQDGDEWICDGIVHKIQNERALKDDEKRALTGYFSLLGSRDTVSELAAARECRGQIAECLAAAKSETKEKSRLYCSLGVLAAAFTVVFFI